MSATDTTALIHVTDGQIVAGPELEFAIKDLTARAELVKAVSDQESYAEALEICADGEADVKMIRAAAEPERLRLQRILDELRDQRNVVIKQIEDITSPLNRMARDWNINRERAEAKAEEDRVNRGKKPEQRVHVQPNIPTVPGKRIVLHYRAEVLNPSALLNAYVGARGPRKEFLRQFVTVDQQAIQKVFREEIKDPKEAAKVIPGVKFTIE
jgi:chromosome segregation ATPase